MSKEQSQKIVQTIAIELKEKNKQLISRIIKIAGAQFANDILEQTRQIQAKGGMMTVDKKRKRTAGGTFFKLAKDQLTPELREKVFPPKDWKAFNQRKKAKKKAQQENVQMKKAPASSSNQQQSSDQIPQPSRDITPNPQPVEQAISPDNADKLAQLEEAAHTLRKRIADMEEKGQKGIKMTKILLNNTEKQIEQLKVLA